MTHALAHFPPEAPLPPEGAPVALAAQCSVSPSEPIPTGGESTPACFRCLAWLGSSTQVTSCCTAGKRAGKMTSAIDSCADFYLNPDRAQLPDRCTCCGAVVREPVTFREHLAARPGMCGTCCEDVAA